MYAFIHVEWILSRLTSDIHRPSPCMSSQGVGVAAGLLSPLLITVILEADTLQRHALQRSVMFPVIGSCKTVLHPMPIVHILTLNLIY